MTTVPDQPEIDEVLNWCAESADSGQSAYPGKTFEEGVEAAIRWLSGERDRPDQD